MGEKKTTLFFLVKVEFNDDDTPKQFIRHYHNEVYEDYWYRFKWDSEVISFYKGKVKGTECEKYSDDNLCNPFLFVSFMFVKR